MIRFWLSIIDPVTGDVDKTHRLHDENVVMLIVPRVGESVWLPAGPKQGTDREYLVKQVSHSFARYDKPDQRREEPHVTVTLERRS